MNFIIQGPAAFKVHVPLMADKPEWKLNGQTLTFTMPLTESVAALKVKIQETVGMPPAKQKLQCDVRIGSYLQFEIPGS